MVKFEEVFCKMEEFITRITRFGNYNWPELNRYCGCCRLSTGIYIRCILSLVLVSLLLTLNAFGLSGLLSTASAMDGVNITVIDNQFNTIVTEENMITIQKALNALKIYLIIWNVLKLIYTLTILATFYAIYFKKPRLLKITFYMMIPNWIFDIIVLFGAKIFLHISAQILFLFGICSEFYNLVAINSQYKQMAFKSRIVPEDALTGNTVSSFTNTSEAWNPNMYSGIHCRTCTCSTSPDSDPDQTRSARTTTTSLQSPETSVSEVRDASLISETGSKQEEKVVNFKDGPIIFNQEQLEGRPDSLFVNEMSNIRDRDERSGETSRRSRRPNSLALY